ncbi:Acetyl-coenzyme A synthetase [Serratia entomophila]|nr:Acetyl-coenzyme A synthetase [Serratia entomophila]CAI1708415.1 Acetyl-coenzyme A synthetase [Serratia entomophila]
MSQLHKHAIPSAIAEHALINPEQYQQYYQQSVQDPEAFWGGAWQNPELDQTL